MNEYTELQAKEQLKMLKEQGLLIDEQYYIALKMIESGELSPEEICTGFGAFVASSSRHM